MNPHDLAPLTVVADELPLPEPLRNASGKGIYAVNALKVGDLLAEPPKRSGEWCPGVVRRLIAASTGPVAVGIRRADYRERLEAAGWFCAAENADLESARAASWPALNVARRLGIGAGNPRPSIVLVGESCNRAGQIPFASRAGTWLFASLRLLGYDELTFYVTNALSLRRRRRTKQLAKLHESFSSSEPYWIGLGKAAQEVLKASKIDHLKVPSPSWHKQFKHSEDTIGYAKRISDAGLPQGPWNPLGQHKPVPAPDVVSLPELPAPYDLRSIAYAKGRSTPSSRAGAGRQVDSAKREAARRMYITGEAPSLRAAAEAVGANVHALKQAAKKGDWVAERDEHQREATERAKAAHLAVTEDYVGKAMADALKLSWGSLRVGLGDVAKRLRNGSLQPTPQQVESLSRVALSLRAASEGQHDPELDALVQEPLAQLARRTLEQLEKGLGGA